MLPTQKIVFGVKNGGFLYVRRIWYIFFLNDGQTRKLKLLLSLLTLPLELVAYTLLAMALF